MTSLRGLLGQRVKIRTVMHCVTVLNVFTVFEFSLVMNTPCLSYLVPVSKSPHENKNENENESVTFHAKTYTNVFPLNG